jgi:tetratricopeptide (TPR) repeat protein
MPSHIYSMLGMWDESVRSNLAAEAAANEYAARNFPDATDPAVPHLLDFRIYAYLQLGKDGDAANIIDLVPRLKKFATVRLTVETALAAIPARFALERGKWDEAAKLTVRDSQYPAAESITYFARALGAARSSQPAVTHAEIAHLGEIEAKLDAAKDNYWAGQTRIQRQAATAWIAFVEGHYDEAIDAMRKAAALDDASEKNVAMENKLVPIRALLGELYLAAGMNEEALLELEASLKSMPNRYRMLAAAATAARAVGMVDVAKRHYRALTALTAAGEAQRPELAEAKSFLSQN